MGEPAAIWSKLSRVVEEVISTKHFPKKFSGIPYYLCAYYLGKSRAEIVAEMIRNHGYLARVDHPVERSGTWYIYVRRRK